MSEIGDSGSEVQAGNEVVNSGGSGESAGRAPFAEPGEGDPASGSYIGAATWGTVPDWNSYPGSSEVVIVDAEEMRRQQEMATSQTEMATNQTAPPKESVERSEESGLQKLVKNAGELAGQLGEYTKDMKELEKDLSGHTKTVGATDSTMEHPGTDAPVADPIVSAMLALGATAHVAYKAWTGKDQASPTMARPPGEERDQ